MDVEKWWIVVNFIFWTYVQDAVVHTLTVDRQCTTQPITLLDIQAALLTTDAANNDDVTEGLAIGDTGYEVARVITKNERAGDEGGWRAVIAKHDSIEGKTSIIAYRGNDATNVLDKLKSDLEDYGETEVYFAGKKTKVNKYAWLSFSRLYYQLEKFLYHPDRRYIFTGHSLGGAMASLLAIMTKSRNQGIPWHHPGTCLITFGQPRVGDKAYAIRHDELISPTRKLRFVNRYDIIPHIPTASIYQHHSREVWINKQTEKFPSTLLKNEHGLTYWKICGEGEPMYCSNRLSLLRLSASNHAFMDYKQSILHPPGFYYSIRDLKSYFDWTIALDRSCPSSKREYSFVLPHAQGLRNSGAYNGITNHPSEPFRKSADRWLHSAKEYANQLLSHSSHSNIHYVKHLVNNTDVLHDAHDVVYALNALPTSWSKHITPVMSNDVPKVIYLKQGKSIAQKQQLPQKQQQQHRKSISMYPINSYMPTSHHSVKGKTVPVSRAVPASEPYDEKKPTAPKLRVIHISAPRPLPPITKPSHALVRHTDEVTDDVASTPDVKQRHAKVSPLLHENPRPITITHMVMTSSSHAGEPIPVTHMVRNNPKSPQLLAVRGSAPVPHRAPHVVATMPPSKPGTITVPYAIVDEPGGGRRVVSLKRLKLELSGGKHEATEHYVGVTTERSDTRNLKSHNPKNKEIDNPQTRLSGLKVRQGEEEIDVSDDKSTNKDSTEYSAHQKDNESVQKATSAASAESKATMSKNIEESSKYFNQKSPTKDIEFESVGDLLAYVHDNIFQFPSKAKDGGEQSATQVRQTNTQTNQSKAIDINNRDQSVGNPGHNIFDNYVTTVDNKNSDSGHGKGEPHEDETDAQRKHEVSDLLHVLDEQEEHMNKDTGDGTLPLSGRVQEDEEDETIKATNEGASKSTMTGLSDMLDVLSAQETRLGDSWKNHKNISTADDVDN